MRSACRPILADLERLMRARFWLLRDAGHDQGCSLVFAAQLASAQIATRQTLSVRRCVCLDRRPAWKPPHRWRDCAWCGAEFWSHRQARPATWCSDRCRQAGLRKRWRAAS